MIGLSVDVDKLTLRDVGEVEKMVGRPVMTAELATGNVAADTFAAILAVLARKADPNATLDSILDAPLSALAAGVTGGAQPDPTPAAD